MSSDKPLREHGYIIDPESGAEMARLLTQDRLITKAMGGLLPELSDLSSIQRLLDVACGPGGWALEVAATHPTIEIMGIDISQTMIQYAQAQAHARGLANAQFRVMDVTKPLEFPNASFDLVNGRILTGFLQTTEWPSLMRECARVLRPGGIIHFTEPEYGFTNSPALDQLTAWTGLALLRAGQCFSPQGRTFGTTPMLRLFLQAIGCQSIQHMAHVVDYSVGTELHASNVQNLQIIYKLLQPFFVGAGVADQERIEQVYQQMLLELQQEDFGGLDYYLTVWGKIP
jgi:ubiquinone/menaquinone biosynthesis C-methylase UbiE